MYWAMLLLILPWFQAQSMIYLHVLCLVSTRAQLLHVSEFGSFYPSLWRPSTSCLFHWTLSIPNCFLFHAVSICLRILGGDDFPPNHFSHPNSFCSQAFWLPDLDILITHCLPGNETVQWVLFFASVLSMVLHACLYSRSLHIWLFVTLARTRTIRS